MHRMMRLLLLLLVEMVLLQTKIPVRSGLVLMLLMVVIVRVS